MNKYIIAAAVMTSLFIGSCKIEKNPSEWKKDWIPNLINHFKSQEVGNPPQSILEYEYNGETVYYIPPQCCDQFSVLLSCDSTYICAPDGGIHAMGDRQCPDFMEKATFKRVVWQDDRK